MRSKQDYLDQLLYLQAESENYTAERINLIESYLLEVVDILKRMEPKE